MEIYSLVFYLFAFLVLGSATMVIFSRNPVHSVLWLILTFISASAIFLLQGAEFLAMVLVVVYVGALAVMFLFVVMMLNINLERIKKSFHSLLPLCFLIAAVLIFDLYVMYNKSFKSHHLYQSGSTEVVVEQVVADKLKAPFAEIIYEIPSYEQITNAHALGAIIYTEFFYAFQLCGIILLIAMMSAIVLTLRERRFSKRQDVGKQVSRNSKRSIEIVKVDFRKGVDV
jgi:NADH-quinone oxidoreductase subunit J